MVIGHEISHAFDDQGSQSDAQGNLRNWWTPGTREKFHEKTKCVVDQYSSFRDNQTGLNLKGFVTQGENIADIVGRKIAYKAYGNAYQTFQDVALTFSFQNTGCKTI